MPLARYPMPEWIRECDSNLWIVLATVLTMSANSYQSAKLHPNYLEELHIMCMYPFGTFSFQLVH